MQIRRPLAKVLCLLSIPTSMCSPKYETKLLVIMLMLPTSVGNVNIAYKIITHVCTRIYIYIYIYIYI
jgi:hypothetical protein